MLGQEKKGVGVRVDPSSWSVGEWKKIEIFQLEATGIARLGPGFMFAIVAACSAGGAGTVTLHDDQSAASSAKMTIELLASTSWGWAFNPPVYFSRGLYVALSANVTAVTFHLLPWNP